MEDLLPSVVFRMIIAMDNEKLFEMKLFSEYATTKWLSAFIAPVSLYHYTGVEGYNGIIKNNSLTFRFTQSDCFDDNTEGLQILKYYKKACKRLLIKKRISREFYEVIKNLKPSKIKVFKKDSNHIECSTFKCYISCFTDKGNSKKMLKK